MHIGTLRNIEQSGNRNSLALSGALRKIPNVRHLDVDMIQWNTSYTQATIVFESTSQKVGKNTQRTKAIAKALGAHSLLIIHEWEDVDEEHPVTVTVWDETGEQALPPSVMTWDDFRDVCSQIDCYYRTGSYE